LTMQRENMRHRGPRAEKDRGNMVVPGVRRGKWNKHKTRGRGVKNGKQRAKEESWKGEGEGDGTSSRLFRKKELRDRG